MVASKDKVRSRNGGLKKVISNRLVRAVVLNPDLVTAKVEMDDRSVQPPPTLPARIPQLVVADIIVEDEFDFCAFGSTKIGIVAQNLLHNLSEFLYSRHRTISSLTGSPPLIPIPSPPPT